VSKGHEGYDEEATYLKYRQVIAAQSGPTTCAKFKAIDPARCEGCPFAATVKTPVNTARLSRPATKAVTLDTEVTDDEGNKETETVTIPLPPKPYFRGETGGVYVRQKQQSEEGEWDEIITKVYDYDVYPTKRLRTESL